MNSRYEKGFWLIVIITGIIVFFHLGGLPLLDPDEPVYAETPKEMFQFHDFISPRIYGQYWYDKPPMYYWLVAASFKLFGMNEFAARFPSAFLAIVCALVVYWYVKKMFTPRAAVLSALVLATSIEYFYLAKAAVTDITLTLCLTVCLLSFWRKQYKTAYIFAGLATLAKGPVGLIFPGTIIILYLAATRNLGELKRIKMPSGLLLYALVAVPWYWVMYKIHGNVFIDTFLGFNNITRFTSPEHPEGVLWYYFIPVLIVGFFPWTAILIQSVWTSLTQSTRDFKGLLFVNIWAAFIFIFFTISRTKLVSYILPMYPPLAIVSGWYIDYLWSNYRHRGINYGWIAMLLLLSAGLIAGMVLGVKHMPMLQFGAYLSAGIFTVMALVSAYFIAKKQFGRAVGTQLVAMVLFSMVLVGSMFPAIASQFTTKYLATEFTAQYDGSSPVYVTKFLHPGFTYYTNVYGTECKDSNELKEALQKPGKAYYVLRKSEFNSLVPQASAGYKVLWQQDDKVLLEKMLGGES